MNSTVFSANTTSAGIATSGGHVFAVARVDDSDPTASTDEFISWRLQLDGPGEVAVAVAKAGWDGTGPWGIDTYRPTSGQVLGVEEARRWAHAILAAADLAEQLEHAGMEQPC